VTTLEPEHPDVVARNLVVGARLLAGATTFVFFCPFFAYLYLRALDSSGLWRPAGVDPPQVLGAAITVLIVVSSVALVLASRPTRASSWMPLVALSFALGLAAVVLQCVAYVRLGFGPTDRGYASVYVAWTGLSALFVLGTMLWLETLLAYGLRNRGASPDSAAVLKPRLEALAFYWAYLAGLAVVMWATLYLA
jgi:heme/copper-type cytochrome/quinol oxidase subunit 3